MKELLNQGVLAPKGFLGAAVHSGVKKRRKDLSLLISENPCVYGGVYTRNHVKAAPVKYNMKRLENKDLIKGVVINSGNANACTGKQGHDDNLSLAQTLAHEMDYQVNEVLVASTGVIGVPMPVATIEAGIHQAVTHLSRGKESSQQVAKGILTTDTFIKEVAVEIEIRGEIVTLGAMAKGSGMIHPNMGTMLAFITTDLDISQELLQEAVRSTVDDTYNMISVDGDTSTNDMVTVLANGMAGNKKLVQPDGDYHKFKKALHYVNQTLAKMVVVDGEGATKLIQVTVDEMPSVVEAKKMVHAVITSNLVKTAFFGQDANWGRILCALGYSGADFDPGKVDLYYENNQGRVQLLKAGMPLAFDEGAALEILKEKEIKVYIQCHQGEEKATGWGCDLSYDYVKINGEYRT